MVQHDVLLRQVQQLADVLARVLFQRRIERPDAAQEALADGLLGALGLDLASLHAMPRADVEALCAPGGVAAGDLACALADLLAQDAHAAGRERALWLYDAAIGAGHAVPFDVYARMAALRETLPGRGR